MSAAAWRNVWSWLQWLLWALLCLQLAWGLRIATMNWLMPSSTAMQRSEAMRLLRTGEGLAAWSHTPLAHGLLPDPLRRAVVASEDAKFFQHWGVDAQALQSAWARWQAGGRVMGGSTISQQLAKNLFLSGERQFWRKGQELLIALGLELMLSKSRLLDIYLNHVEWGEGVFGAEAAAQAHFGEHAWALSAAQAARLAVMLPSPKRFEAHPQSRYLRQRAAVIRRRMSAVDLPPPQP